MTVAVVVLSVLLGLAVIWGVIAGTAAYGLMYQVDGLKATVIRQRTAIAGLANRVIAWDLDAADIERWEADQ